MLALAYRRKVIGMEKDNNIFLDSLNKEIDRKIALIEAGKMEMVTRLTAFDYILSVVITIISFVAMVWAYFCLC